MHIYTKEQRFLLKGIAEVSAKIHTIDDMDVFSLQEQNRRLQLKRVIKALLHDAAKETLNLHGKPQQTFKAGVKMATEIRKAEDVEAFRRFVDSYFDPPPVEVTQQLTLPFEG